MFWWNNLHNLFIPFILSVTRIHCTDHFYFIFYFLWWHCLWLMAAAMEVGVVLVGGSGCKVSDEDTIENRRLLLTPKWCSKVVEAMKEHSLRGTGQLMLPFMMRILECALCKPTSNLTERGQRQRYDW
jgi:hypothetical protein